MSAALRRLRECILASWGSVWGLRRPRDLTTTGATAFRPISAVLLLRLPTCQLCQPRERRESTYIAESLLSNSLLYSIPGLTLPSCRCLTMAKIVGALLLLQEEELSRLLPSTRAPLLRGSSCRLPRVAGAPVWQARPVSRTLLLHPSVWLAEQELL